MNMTLSRVLGGIGRVLISAGALILLFVAYQLWGTGLQTRAAQDRLENEFEQQLADWEAQQQETPIDVSAPDPDPTTSSSNPSTTSDDGDADDGDDDGEAEDGDTGEDDSDDGDSGDSDGGQTPADTTEATAPPTTVPPITGTTVPNIPELPENGEAVASLDIPDIGLNWTVVEGVDVEDLKKGPGHYPGTPMPGQPGNAAIAGHRTTHGAPFFRVNELEPGDPIFVRTLQGQFEYRVTESLVVQPEEYDRVINLPEGDLLTLTSCHPRYSAAQRFIVHAELVGEAVPGYTPEQLAAQLAAAERAGQFGAPDEVEVQAVNSAPANTDQGEAGDDDTDTADDDGDSADSESGDDGDNGDTGDDNTGAGGTDTESSDSATTEPAVDRADELAAPDLSQFQTLDQNDGALTDPGAWGPVIPWAMLAGGAWFATWLLGRQWRKIPAYGLGLPIFLLFLFMFFEKFSLLLPAAY